jgi:hypothetical protein
VEEKAQAGTITVLGRKNIRSVTPPLLSEPPVYSIDRPRADGEKWSTCPQYSQSTLMRGLELSSSSVGRRVTDS